jgi:DNA-binding XRE family transcriptional regulator
MANRPALVAARETAGHTQVTFARAVGVERSTVQRWEGTSARPNPKLRPLIAKALRLALRELDVVLAVVPDATEPAPDTVEVLTTPWLGEIGSQGVRRNAEASWSVVLR